jgi:homocitrate synthase NifV
MENSINNPYIIDTTLRDGEQAPGVVFSAADKLAIATILDKLGVDEVEAGTPVVGKEEKDAVRIIASSGFSFVTSSWCRANHDEILAASVLGAGSVNISLPVSDIQIEALGKSRLWVIARLKEIVNLACGNFPHITMGAQDASRADTSFLKEFIFHAIDAGAHRIRISDTVGVYDPFETSDVMHSLITEFPEAEFEFHGHNDLGMATANALGALKAGTHCVSATVNGLGERAGNSALEEVLAILHTKFGVRKYHNSFIHELSAMVSKISGRPLSVSKPLVGDKVFTHESGIHTAALLRNIHTYQLLDPAEYGMPDVQFCFGKHSGSSALIRFLHLHGIQPCIGEIQEIMDRIKFQSVKQKRSLTNAETVELVKYYLSGYKAYQKIVM